MAMVITVAQQKGGAGKTTLAANLAAAFAPERRVALLDIDPQRSLTRWHEIRMARRPQPVVIDFSNVSGWRLRAELDRLRGTHDLVLVDSPPQIETDAKLAIRGADLVLVPLQPSPPDLWATEGTLKLVADEGRKVSIVMNRAAASSSLRSRIEKEMASRGLPVLNSALGNRTGFATAFAAGLGVTESSPRSTAATEMMTLLDEVRRILG